MKDEKTNVIVVGGGTAAFEAAVTAKQSGAERVVILEKAPESEFRRQCPLLAHRLSLGSCGCG